MALDRTSMRFVVFEYVKEHPGQSAYQIAIALGYKWSSVSARLYEWIKSGMLRRLQGKGPKGGYGYYVSRYIIEHDELNKQYLKELTDATRSK